MRINSQTPSFPLSFIVKFIIINFWYYFAKVCFVNKVVISFALYVYFNIINCVNLARKKCTLTSKVVVSCNISLNWFGFSHSKVSSRFRSSDIDFLLWFFLCYFRYIGLCNSKTVFHSTYKKHYQEDSLEMGFKKMFPKWECSVIYIVNKRRLGNS